MKTIATLLIAITLVACEKKDVNPEPYATEIG